MPFFRALHNIDLPEPGKYATGILFLDALSSEQVEQMFTEMANENKLTIICWRTVPKNSSVIGQVARSQEPLMRQVFIKPTDDNCSPEDFRRHLFVLRKLSTHKFIAEGFRYYACSLSPSIVVYKGQFTPGQLWQYFDDLQEPEFQTYLAIVHARFSTNTYPSWERAHPNRYLAHNGEINTLRGNINLMRAREGVMHSDWFGAKLNDLYPVVEPNMSDSGSMDNVLEFLCTVGGRSLPEAIMTMVPEAWHNVSYMPDEKRKFYQWASCIMEPWDGPALLTFTDGRYIGAILDRNGLRPARYYQTINGDVILASEVGVIDVPHSEIIVKQRLKAGRMLLIDTQEKLVVKDEEIKRKIVGQNPYQQWVDKLIDIDVLRKHAKIERETIKRQPTLLAGRSIEEVEGRAKVLEDRRLSMFAYTTETINMLLLPMVNTSKEALGSMGNDEPLACISLVQPLIFGYFKQLFAQVTNPPIDPFREKVVMSVSCPIGPEANLLVCSEQQCQRLWLKQPILSINDMESLKNSQLEGWRAKVIDCVFPVAEGREGLVRRLIKIREEASKAVQDGFTVIILSDRKAGPEFVPVK